MSDEAIAVSIDGGLFVPEEYSLEILKTIQDDPQIIDKEITVDYTTLATALKSLDFWVTEHPGHGTRILGYGRKLEEHYSEYPTMSISWKEYNPHKLIQHLAERAVSGGLYVEVDTQGQHVIFAGSPEPIWDNISNDNFIQHVGLYDDRQHMVTIIKGRVYRSTVPVRDQWDFVPMKRVEAKNALNEAWEAINRYSIHRKNQHNE
jgi:hypothetical protein